MFDGELEKTKSDLRKISYELPHVKHNDLADKFLSVPQLKIADVVMLYVGVGNETDTIPLINLLLSMGKKVVLPVCLPNREMEVREIESVSDLAPGKFKIPEPGQHCRVVPKKDVDIVLLPYVLCDTSGYRLGRGGGYYDRWLIDFRGLTVLIASNERVVEKLPVGPHDIPADILLVV